MNCRKLKLQCLFIWSYLYNIKSKIYLQHDTFLQVLYLVYFMQRKTFSDSYLLYAMYFLVFPKLFLYTYTYQYTGILNNEYRDFTPRNRYKNKSMDHQIIFNICFYCKMYNRNVIKMGFWCALLSAGQPGCRKDSVASY